LLLIQFEHLLYITILAYYQLMYLRQSFYQSTIDIMPNNKGFTEIYKKLFEKMSGFSRHFYSLSKFQIKLENFLMQL